MLEKFDIIRTKKIGKTNYYSLNMASPFTNQIIRIITLEKKELNNIELPTMNIIREFVHQITTTSLENTKKIILFGSHAKRTHNENSDIDIAIIMKEKNINDELLITEAISRLKKRFGKEIQPHYFTEKEFKEQRKNKLITEIIKDGIILN